MIKERPNPLGLPAVIEGVDAFEREFKRSLGLLEGNEELQKRVNILAVGNPVSVQAVPDASTWVDEMIAGATAKADKWATNAANAVDTMKAESLTSGARYAAGVTAAVQNKSYDKGVQGIDTASVRATIQAVGASGYSSGISNRKQKILTAITRLQPKVAALKATINNMPKETDAQREERLKAARRGMIAIGKT
jgi:outer membrane murein-binding lipoprotein Lpp